MLGGLPEFALEGIGALDARALLDATVPGRVDERVRDRILAEAAGNPLALRIEQGFVRQLEPLPHETRCSCSRRPSPSAT